MEAPITPLITHTDRSLASTLGMIQIFEAAASALKNAWWETDRTDPMDSHFYWGAYAAKGEACQRWGDIRDLGGLLKVGPQCGMWLAVLAEKQGGAA